MEISLKQFLDRNIISFRLFSICSQSNINSLGDLKRYLKSNRNFDDLRDLKNEEKVFLIDLCNGIIKSIQNNSKTQVGRKHSDLYRTQKSKTKNETILYDQDPGLSLKKLLEEGEMSPRVYNICDDAGLKGLNHLRIYIVTNGNFENLLSKKASKELCDFCSSYKA